MPTPARTPAFQFYPAAWLNSTSVELMSAEVEGTYIRLLARQWIAVVLPKDEKSLQKLTKLKPRAFTKAWSFLSIHFPITPDGTGRQNPTLFALFQEREAFKEQMRENGQKGGRPKNQKLTRSLAEANQKGNQNESSVSVSVSNSFTRSNNDDDEERSTRARATTPKAIVVQMLRDISPCVGSVAHDALGTLLVSVADPVTWAGIIRSCASGQSMPNHRPATPERLAAAIQDFVAAGHHEANPPRTKLFRGFVANSKASPPPERHMLDVNADKAEELRTIRAQNERRRARRETERPEPTWAAEIDAMYPDGRTRPAGVAA